jgi:hypothetical protein
VASGSVTISRGRGPQSPRGQAPDLRERVSPDRLAPRLGFTTHISCFLRKLRRFLSSRRALTLKLLAGNGKRRHANASQPETQPSPAARLETSRVVRRGLPGRGLRRTRPTRSVCTGWCSGCLGGSAQGGSAAGGGAARRSSGMRLRHAGALAACAWAKRRAGAWIGGAGSRTARVARRQGTLSAYRVPALVASGRSYCQGVTIL